MIPDSDLAELRDQARALGDDLVRLRRDLHQDPELGLHLPHTQAAVLSALAGLPLEVSTGRDLTSVTAVLRGGRPGPVVLLRADMDALPVQEETGEPFASRVPDTMHACGHDLHVAGLVGAARLLSVRAGDLAGAVVLMFQPGEELGGGAKVMLDEGLLQAAGETPVAGYALHVSSALLPSGVVACRPGPALAAADTLEVVARGRGGHASMPHLARDPVPAICEMVTALHTMTTRRLDPFDPVVLTVGALSAGTASNVIAESARLEASVRSFSQAAREAVLEAARGVCLGVARAHGVEAEVTVELGYPVTVNHPDEAARVARVARALLGPRRYYEAPNPLPGSEDFSYVLEEIPGAYFGIGATPTGVHPLSAPYNHSPQARFDDKVLPDAAAMMAALALDRLSDGSDQLPTGVE
jgi:hippurate hydrolase